MTDDIAKICRIYVALLIAYRDDLLKSELILTNQNFKGVPFLKILENKIAIRW